MRDFSTVAPSLRFGIDLGGSKIELIALDAAGQEILRRRVPTPQNDYLATVAAVAALVHQAEFELGQTGSIGIGTPGAISPASGLMKNCNSTCLNGQPLQEDLERALNREVRLANDANCFALSEAVDGAAAGADTVFGVILGTGVGGGVVVRGHAAAMAPTPSPANGDTRRCPISSSPTPRPTAPPPDSIPPPARPSCTRGRARANSTPRPPATAARKAASKPGSPAPRWPPTTCATAAKTCPRTRSCNWRTRATAPAARRWRATRNGWRARWPASSTCIDPDVIVLGGGLSNIARLYDTVPRLWPRYVFSDRVDTRLVPPKYGDSSGVRGAAWLWND